MKGPNWEQRGNRVIKDLAYAPPQPVESRGHLLDLYLPPDGAGRAPLVIWTHGSAWLAENGRDEADAVAAQLNPRGYAVAGVAIRSSRQARFPAQLHDIKAATRWLRLHADEYRLDPHRFAIMGESSGGWTAAMAALSGDRAELEGRVGDLGASSGVQAVVPFYPPTDFLQMDAHMIDPGNAPANRSMPASAANRIVHAGGQRTGPPLPRRHADPSSPESLLIGAPIEQTPAVVKQANPITYVSRDAPPFLILHGELDLMVPYNQSVLLYKALSAACAEVIFVTLPRGEHGRWKEFLEDPDMSSGATLRSSQECRRGEPQPVEPSWSMIIDFFDRHLRGHGR